ncbi:porin family protein [Shewanella sp. KX20019]|uniref:outer membrane beta-barrel protein n=1 Tax=Shewanella sp. KX20019 TaxID=2803864 RepID=UPI0019276282|nr:outer membrane beta-barrel protein [Shewanella sp. KX20019]QQX80704.1 porin family protein [Shewanella sp. KX20019]
MLKLPYLLCLALFAIALPTYAEDSIEQAASHHKINLTFGLAKAKESLISYQDDNDLGAFISLGYNYFLTPKWAIDSFAYAHRPKTPLATERVYAQGWGLGAMYKQKIALSSWSWSAKLGMHNSIFSYRNNYDKNNSIHVADEVIRPYWGVGIDWELSRNLSLAFSYTRLNYGKDNFSRTDCFCTTLSYNF